MAPHIREAAMSTVLISIFCPDRTGLVAAITGRLFELGADLGDTSFAMLGTGAEFTSVCDLPAGIPAAELESDLAALPELAGATVSVRPFELDAATGPLGRISHRIVLSGGDRPGLIARLSEVFGSFKANIVRLDAHRLPEQGLYVTRLAVAIPERAEACLNTVANTAGELGLSCHVDEA
ncbi:MAG: amino acid-binding protein [Magnetospirillum sp.]|nr:amino acid-binding protein [Magnetospirillum sp.]